VLDIALDVCCFAIFATRKKSVFSRLLGSFATDIPTNFQDRLVVTASIFLHIYGVVHYTIYMQSYFEVARKTRFTNPLRIPHEDASSSPVSGKCGYPRQRYSCDVVNHLTNYLIVRYCVICARFCENMLRFIRSMQKNLRILANVFSPLE